MITVPDHVDDEEVKIIAMCVQLIEKLSNAELRSRVASYLAFRFIQTE